MGTDQRKIVGLMFITVIFAVVGEEIKQSKKPQQSNSTAVAEITGPARVLLGGIISAAILSGIASTGELGSQVGTGLAGLAAVTAVLVEGSPVWSGLTRVLNGKPASAPLPTAGNGPHGTPTVQS